VTELEAEPEANRPSPSDGSHDRRLPPWFSRAVALVAGWVVLLVAGAWAVLRLRSLLMMVVVAFFLSLAMEPAVDALSRRGWRRGAATGLVLGVTVLVVLGFLAAAGSIVVGQAHDLIDHAPRYVREAERFVNDDLGIKWNADSLVRKLRHGRGPLPSNNQLVSSAFDAVFVVGRALLEIVTVIIFAFYMTADGPRLRRSICALLPSRHQEVVLDTWEIAIDKTGGYLYSRGIQAIVSAVVTTVFLYALGVPYAFALGLWVGVISQFIPTIGTYIALVVPVLVALKSEPIDALWVLLFLVAYQQFENYVLGPRVTKRTMDVHPALAIGTVFAGGLLLGGVGAVLALPATAVIQAVISQRMPKQEVLEVPLTADPSAEPASSRRTRRRVRRRGSRSRRAGAPRATR
jgi:predicted PurR-regulated permease PerM